MDRDLIIEINKMKKGEAGRLVAQKTQEFKNLSYKGNKKWFSELSFCILTANSTAKLGLRIQRELGSQGFLKLPYGELSHRLKMVGHRFPNTRARFIVEARRFHNIKDIIMKFEDAREAREWLVKNVKGIGWKEASHFLRNVGFGGVAILDRHVLRTMYKYKLVDAVPKTLTRERYLRLEEKLVGVAQELGLPLGELDLYLWFMEAGKILK